MLILPLYFLACGGFIESNMGSLRYPESNKTLKYGSNLNCAWTIVVNDSSVLNISFVWIEIEKSNDCHLDYVEVKANKLYFHSYFNGHQ